MEDTKPKKESLKSNSKERITQWASRKFINPEEGEVGSSLWKRNRFIVDGLMSMYSSEILPLERECRSVLRPSDYEIRESEWHANPIVLLLGQYSTGKTTFIKHLIGGYDFPGIHIGPEPTTDKFLALIHASEKDPKAHASEKTVSLFRNGKVIKGNSLTVMPELPFAGLSSFGSAFLDHFEGSVVNDNIDDKNENDNGTYSPTAIDLVKHVTIVDTPGVLSGETNQRLSRRYDFAQVAKWFADRADMILLLFDAHKLDISDEYQTVIESIRESGNAGKIRCVLNKADSVDKEELVRVYGSLMWSMGKIFRTPEVARVYCGSFWNEELRHDDFQQMFDNDEDELVTELRSLPFSTAERKVNLMVKRVRLVKVHMCILGYLKSKMPYFGKTKAQHYMIDNLEKIIEPLMEEFNFSSGDLPDDMDHFKETLRTHDFMEFPTLDRKLLYKLDDLIVKDIPALIRQAEIMGEKKANQKENDIEESKIKSRSATSSNQVPFYLDVIVYVLMVIWIVVIGYFYHEQIVEGAQSFASDFPKHSSNIMSSISENYSKVHKQIMSYF